MGIIQPQPVQAGHQGLGAQQPGGGREDASEPAEAEAHDADGAGRDGRQPRAEGERQRQGRDRLADEAADRHTRVGWLYPETCATIPMARTPESDGIVAR